MCAVSSGCDMRIWFVEFDNLSGHLKIKFSATNFTQWRNTGSCSIGFDFLFF